MLVRVAIATLVFGLCACTAQHTPLSSTEVTGNVTWPKALPAKPADPPQILAVHLSAVRVHAGGVWSGKIATSTNVASLEVRAPSFTFNAPRTSFGQFEFNVHTAFIPPMYRRIYTVAFVARNANGQTDERDVIVDFR